MNAKNRNQVLGTVVAILAIIGIAWAVMAGVGQPGVKERIQMSEQIKEGSVAPYYKTTPPTSGAYYPSAANCRIYDTELPVPQFVHNLRNGNIVLLYKRAIDSTTWGKIRTLQDTLANSGWFLAAPYENMTKKLSIVAWGWHLDLDEYDERQIMDFYDSHKEQGMEHTPCLVEKSFPPKAQITSPGIPSVTAVPVK